MSAIQMAAPIGTPLCCWNLTFEHFSQSQALLEQPNNPFKPLNYTNWFKNITVMAIQAAQLQPNIAQALLRQRRNIRNLKFILKIDHCIFFTLPGTAGVRKPPIQAFRLLRSAQKQLIYACRVGPILASVLTIQRNFFDCFIFLSFEILYYV